MKTGSGGSMFPPLKVATTYRKSVRRNATVWWVINYLRGWIKQIEQQNHL